MTGAEAVEAPADVDLGGAVEQHVHRLAGLALGHDLVALGERDLLAHPDDLGDVLVGDAGEERCAAQGLGLDGGVAHAFAPDGRCCP